MSRRKKPGEIFVDGIQPTEISDSEKSDSVPKRKSTYSPTRSESCKRNWEVRRKRAAAEKETEMKKTSDSQTKETAVDKETVVREEETVASCKGVSPEEMARRLPDEVYRHNVMQQFGREVATSDHPTTLLIRKSLEVAMLPKIDMTDPLAVRARILEYFEIEARYQNKPTVSGLAMALNGMNRMELWAIRTGNAAQIGGIISRLPSAVVDEVKTAHALMEQMWENNMQNGAINPVVGIFLGKNNFGYMDRTDYVITPNAGDSEYSQQEIRERLGLPASDSDE